MCSRHHVDLVVPVLKASRASVLRLTERQRLPSSRVKAHHAKREEYDKKLKQILTDDQYKSWKKRHGRHGGHRNGQRQQTAND